MSRTYFFRHKDNHTNVLWAFRTESGNFEVINGRWWFVHDDDGYYMNTKYAHNNGDKLNLEVMPVGQCPKKFLYKDQYNEAIDWAIKKMTRKKLEAVESIEPEVERRVERRRTEEDRRDVEHLYEGEEYEEEIPF